MSKNGVDVVVRGGGGGCGGTNDEGDAYTHVRSSGGFSWKRRGGVGGESETRKRQVKRRTNEEKRDTVTAPGANFREGTGRVTSNGVTLQGFNTTFKTELCPGDKIGVNHPRSLVFEESTVVTVLSQRTLTMTEAFSSELVSTTSFYVKKDSEKLKANIISKLKGQSSDEVINPVELEQKMSEEVLKKESAAIKKSGGGVSSMPIRERSGMWGYKNTVERLDKFYTQEELLDMRIKRVGRDKYC